MVFFVDDHFRSFPPEVKVSVEILHGVTPKFHSVECVEFTSQIPIVYSENGIQWDT